MYGQQNIFFIGIGGIGMSALARYFRDRGALISGYDAHRSHITDALQKEGVQIFFEDDISRCPKNPALIVYTPAIPKDCNILNYFSDKRHIPLKKRSEVLADITNTQKCFAVAGTHGKTTTSSILGHIYMYAKNGGTSIIGGISNNYKSNYFKSKIQSKNIIVEADEFDRSFLRLKPYMAIITSTDADHLDIYKSHDKLTEAFQEFALQVDKEGAILLKKGLKIHANARVYTYDINDEAADFSIQNIRQSDGYYYFDLLGPKVVLSDLCMPAMGRINIENALAASALALLDNVEKEAISVALKTYKGVYRRFEYLIREPELILIDDYAHHPTELKALIGSVKEIYPDQAICCVFQPHLYSRTQDFAQEFARELSACNCCYLLDIYPAREKPIVGVSSRLILNQLKDTEGHLCSKEELSENLAKRSENVFLLAGAGDIDKLRDDIKQTLINRRKSEI